MFIKKALTATILLVLLSGNVISQQNVLPKTTEISPELQKNAVEFLRQTIKEIPNLKAEENRQYFTIETARLLWKYDEKESRAMFERVMQEVKQSLTKTHEKYKKAVEEIKKARKNSNANYGYYNAVNRPATNAYPSNRAYNSANSNVYVEPEISVYETGMREEFSKIASLRQSLIESLTDVEPVLAYRCLSETNQILPKGLDRYGYNEYSRSLEKRIVTNLLEKNEVDKSVEVARDLLKNDFSEGFLAILRSIYDKDAAKGGVFAEETLQYLKTSPNEKGIYFTEIATFFDNAVENKNQNLPMLSENSLKDLAKLLGNGVLAEMQDREVYFNPYDYAKRIKEYAPREALKIVQKSKLKRYPNNSNSLSNAPYYASNTAGYAANMAANAAKAAANAVAMAANKAANTVPKSKNPKPKPQIIPTPQETKLGELPDEPEIIIDSRIDLFRKLSVGKFTVDEREKVIKQAKKYAFAQSYWGYARPDRFISVVAELARFSIISADKEISDALMKEAGTYVRPETKHAFDYAGKLMLAGGYSKHQPDKSFALMESMVSINEVIEGAVKVGIFIDTESSFISNDEVSASLFLGDLWFGRNVLQTEELRMFIQNLASSDFQRTKGLADKFTRNEVKMTAKMLILDSLLGERLDYRREYYY